MHRYGSFNWNWTHKNVEFWFISAAHIESLKAFGLCWHAMLRRAIFEILLFKVRQQKKNLQNWERSTSKREKKSLWSLNFVQVMNSKHIFRQFPLTLIRFGSILFAYVKQKFSWAHSKENEMTKNMYDERFTENGRSERKNENKFSTLDPFSIDTINKSVRLLHAFLLIGRHLFCLWHYLNIVRVQNVLMATPMPSTIFTRK